MEGIEIDSNSVEEGLKDQQLKMNPELRVVKEKLRLIASVSSLMAGFSIIALVELQLHEGMPQGLTIAYSLVTCLLITLHIFAVLLAVCILPSLEILLHVHSSPLGDVESAPGPAHAENHHPHNHYQRHQHLQGNASDFGGAGQEHNSGGQQTTAGEPSTSRRDEAGPLGRSMSSATNESAFMGVDHSALEHLERMERMELQEKHFQMFKRVAEVAWICSMGLGIMTFGVELLLIIWIKLYEISVVAAICGTIVSAPLVLVFLIIAYFLNRKESAMVKFSLLRKQKSLENKLQSFAALGATLTRDKSN